VEGNGERGKGEESHGEAVRKDRGGTNTNGSVSRYERQCDASWILMLPREAKKKKRERKGKPYLFN